MNPDHPQFNPGGIPNTKDKRDFKWHDVGGAVSLPFDWNLGYDVEQELGIKLKTKNQEQSYSCGGQSFSYYGEVLSTFFDKHYDPKSARFIYSQAFSPEGGGSTSRACADICTGQGFADEVLVSSYDVSGHATEAFMR